MPDIFITFFVKQTPVWGVNQLGRSGGKT